MKNAKRDGQTTKNGHLGIHNARPPTRMYRYEKCIKIGIYNLFRIRELSEMVETLLKVGKHGEVIIPKAIRDGNDIQHGDRVLVDIKLDRKYE